MFDVEYRDNEHTEFKEFRGIDDLNVFASVNQIVDWQVIYVGSGEPLLYVAEYIVSNVDGDGR